MRKIDWTRGKSYTYRIDDVEMLVNSDFLFARKFAENTDRDMIDKIYNYLKYE